MESYITKELPELIGMLFHVDLTRMAVTGHSMGGHGALTLHFRNPDLFKSVSALAPICNPTKTTWG